MPFTFYLPAGLRSRLIVLAPAPDFFFQVAPAPVFFLQAAPAPRRSQNTRLRLRLPSPALMHSFLHIVVACPSFGIEFLFHYAIQFYIYKYKPLVGTKL